MGALVLADCMKKPKVFPKIVDYYFTHSSSSSSVGLLPQWGILVECFVLFISANRKKSWLTVRNTNNRLATHFSKRSSAVSTLPDVKGNA